MLKVAAAHSDTLIRAGRRSDLHGLARVRVDSFLDTYRGVLPQRQLAGMTYRNAADHLRRELARKGSSFLVVEDATGELLGYSQFGAYKPNRSEDYKLPFRGEIYELYLERSAQGQGLGRRLLTATLWGMVDRGLSPALVWALEENTKARGFYEACGATRLVSTPVELGDVVTMKVAYGWYKTLPFPAW